MKIRVCRSINTILSVSGSEEEYNKYRESVYLDIGVPPAYGYYVAMDCDPICNHYIEIVTTTPKSLDFIREHIYNNLSLYNGDVLGYIGVLMRSFNIDVVPSQHFENTCIIEMTDEEFARVLLVQQLSV